MHVLIRPRQHDRDAVFVEVIDHLAKNRHAREVNVRDRHGVDDEVFRGGVLRHHLVQLAAKDAGVGEEDVVVKEHDQRVVDALHALVVQRFPTRRAGASAQFDHLGASGSPGLVEYRQTNRNRESLFHAHQNDAQH